MDLGTFGRAFLIGLSIAAPVGPIGALCIRRTLTDGRLPGLLTGLGAATADGCYGAIAGFGLTIIANALLTQERWLRLSLLDVAAQPGLSPLLSDRALAQAAGDPDGYVRAAAARLAAQRRPSR